MRDREFAVVLEDLRSDFRIFGEGLSALRDEMNRRFEQMERHMDQRFEQVDRRFEQVDRRFEQVDLQFTVLINELHEQRTEFDARLGVVEAKLAS